MPYKDLLKAKEYFKQYRLKNKEKILFKNREWIKNNKEHYVNYHKKYNENNRQWIKVKKRAYLLKKKYNISVKEYDILLKKQNNRCDICRVHQKEFDRPLSVDHNHKTNAVRGLLCIICNTNVGVIEDKLEMIQKYLNKHRKDVN